LFGLFALCFALARPSLADEYRRPGLEGRWTNRHLTAPMNSLRVLLGPGQPMLLGQRYGSQLADGGGQLIRSEAGDEWWVRGGVGFGLTEDWEAGALFLPFRLAPDFAFGNITVFLTRGVRFEDFDTGVRLSFQTPGTEKGFRLNPGIPVLYRAGIARVDSGLFMPLFLRDFAAGLNVPVRGSVNLGPMFFVALESGFVQPNFEVPDGASVPLGALAGYTGLFGSRVLDLTAEFCWDSFWRPASSEALELAAYRVNVGIVLHWMVK
jgi:hypothetical protein